MVQGVGAVHQGTQTAVVGAGRNAQMVTDRNLLGFRPLPPRALEIKQSTIPVAKRHGTSSLPTHPRRSKHSRPRHETLAEAGLDAK